MKSFQNSHIEYKNDTMIRLWISMHMISSSLQFCSWFISSWLKRQKSREALMPCFNITSHRHFLHPLHSTVIKISSTFNHVKGILQLLDQNILSDVDHILLEQKKKKKKKRIPFVVFIAIKYITILVVMRDNR